MSKLLSDTIVKMDWGDAPRYVGSVVVYRGRSHLLCRDAGGFYLDKAKAVRLGNYEPTGEI